MSSSSLLPKQLLQLAAAQRSGGFAFIHLAFLLSVGGGSCSFDKKLRIGLPRERGEFASTPLSDKQDRIWFSVGNFSAHAFIPVMWLPL